MTILFASLLCGCTSPTQRIAERAFTIAMHYDATIVDDLSTLAKQQALDASAREIDLAFNDKNVDKAKLSATNLANTWEKIGFLQIQNERKRALFRIGQQYVLEQRGILNILFEEAVQAKQNSDNKAKAIEGGQSVFEDMSNEIVKSPTK